MAFSEWGPRLTKASMESSSLIPLSDLEREVLTRLTAFPDPVFESLRYQVANAKVQKRTWTGIGFYTDLWLPPEVPSISDPVAGILGTLNAECNSVKYGLGFFVFLRSGRLKQLECFTHAGEPLEPFSLRDCSFAANAQSEIKITRAPLRGDRRHGE